MKTTLTDIQREIVIKNYLRGDCKAYIDEHYNIDPETIRETLRGVKRHLSK